MKSVYLAGPITGLSYEGCNDWREEAIKSLKEDNIAGISPMRAKEYLSRERSIQDEYTEKTMSCQKGITTRDRFDAMNCDLILANLMGATEVSIGTVIECAWADMLRTPIILAMERANNPHEHSMLREIAGFRVDSLKNGLYLAKRILGPY